MSNSLDQPRHVDHVMKFGDNTFIRVEITKCLGAKRYPVICSSKIKLDHFSSSSATKRPTIPGKMPASSHICDAVKQKIQCHASISASYSGL